MRVALASEVPVVSAAELQEAYPAESHADIRRYVALVRRKGISTENARWLVSFTGCVERAISRLEAAELPDRQRPN
ncbi:MAG: hypothetical protein R3D28_16825 [Geminicoccaceae bacterium]|jgi:hypothetical protein|nr:hypothetical protein [Geminicoccaceae bacterium]HRY26572.1 hypothetical protein [Geminicoccaceae bacterium]